MTAPRLILFAGRPGVGKTTLARETAQALGAVYLRIDTIEEGLKASQAPIPDLMDAGYTVAQALASDALAAGQSVVSDAVHGHAASWRDWGTLAKGRGIVPVWLLVTCDDLDEHKARIEERADAGALHGADWDEITSRPLDPFPGTWPKVDTAGREVADCLAEIRQLLESAT